MKSAKQVTSECLTAWRKTEGVSNLDEFVTKAIKEDRNALLDQLLQNIPGLAVLPYDGDMNQDDVIKLLKALRE